MKRVTSIATAILLAVLAVLATRVAAQETNTQERTFMTFSNTVEMPGVTLPAGTYVFRLADTPSRNVVQVLSKDEKDILGQWTFVQAERPKVADDTVVMFKENREGSTPAVQYWYFPGERIGKEFIYPKDQAAKIASRTGQPVLSDEGRVTPQVASTDSQGNVTNWQRESSQASGAADLSASNDSTIRNAPAASVGTSGSDNRPAVDRDQSANVQGSVHQESTQARADQLPKTASPAPLVGLIGLLSLAGALGTRKFAAARR